MRPVTRFCLRGSRQRRIRRRRRDEPHLTVVNARNDFRQHQPEPGARHHVERPRDTTIRRSGR